MTTSALCVNSRAYPKERFASVRAAHKALSRRWSFRNRRYPSLYKCPCGGYHLTNGSAS